MHCFSFANYSLSEEGEGGGALTGCLCTFFAENSFNNQPAKVLLWKDGMKEAEFLRRIQPSPP